MDAKDVEILERERCYRGYLTVERWQLRHRRFDGDWGKPIRREVIDRGHAAAVLPYDPVREEVVLIEQFRPGAFGAGMAPWVIEIVAGVIEPGEAPEALVLREAIEEAGCRVDALIPICKCLASPGVLTESVAIYCGRTDTRGLGGTHGLDHEGEDIRAFVLSFEDSMTLLNDGKITNAISIVALQWLALNHDRVKAIWK